MHNFDKKIIANAIAPHYILPGGPKPIKQNF